MGMGSRKSFPKNPTMTAMGRTRAWSGFSREGMARSCCASLGPSPDSVSKMRLGVPDLSGDGFPDLVVSNSTWEFQGRIWVFSGADGQELYSFLHPSAEGSGGFARNLASMGDCNGDGFGDFAASTRTEDGPVIGLGVARIYSGVCLPAQRLLSGNSQLEWLGLRAFPSG